MYKCNESGESKKMFGLSLCPVVFERTKLTANSGFHSPHNHMHRGRRFSRSRMYSVKFAKFSLLAVDTEALATRAYNFLICPVSVSIYLPFLILQITNKVCCLES